MNKLFMVWWNPDIYSSIITKRVQLHDMKFFRTTYDYDNSIEIDTLKVAESWTESTPLGMGQVITRVI